MHCQLVAARKVDTRSPWRAWAERLQGWLLPPRCVLCLDPGRVEPLLDLCADCEAELPRTATPCVRCGAPGGGEAGCTRCAGRALPYAAVVAPFRYAWPIDALVRGFKYHGRLPYGRVLGTLLAEALLASGAPRPQLLVPVPLHPTRERERGYNQALELARVLGRTLGVPVAAALCERRRATAAQAGLAAAERQANVAGAFSVRGVPPAHVALVDDVMSTGATLAALEAVLRAAGAARVDAWAVARA